MKTTKNLRRCPEKYTSAFWDAKVKNNLTARDMAFICNRPLSTIEKMQNGALTPSDSEIILLRIACKKKSLELNKLYSEIIKNAGIFHQTS